MPAQAIADAQTFRIAFWRVDFDAAGPGAALHDILKQRSHVLATSQIVVQVAPDILVLSGIDHDADDSTAIAFNHLLAKSGLQLPHLFAPVPNSGMATGVDLNGDGRRNGPDDAHGYGRFSGARALLVLSRYPFQTAQVRDFSRMLWRDLPDALLFSGATPKQLAVQRLSSVSHTELPVALPGQRALRLLLYHAGPPRFGDHPDRNLNRNHDETAFWSRLLDGDLAIAPPQAPFVLVGDSNLDPVDGDGLSRAMRELLANPKLQDPQPKGPGGAAQANPDHRGRPELDTAEWTGPQGNLRVSYVLPSTDLDVHGARVVWPLPDSPVAALLDAAGTAHKPVWVDIALN